jgi:hypothetical protein
MTHRAPWLVSAFALLSLTVVSCGRDIVPKQLDEPCTRTAQCDVGLECSAGVCLPIADGGADGGADAG